MRWEGAAFALGAALAGVAALGCTTALDMERARRVLRGPEEPKPPVLVERPAAALAAPSGLLAVSGQLREVPLKWDPLLSGDVAGYVVERAVREEGPFQRIATVLSRYETTYTDQGRDLAAKQDSARGAGDLGDGNVYFYRVRAFDSAGHVSANLSRVVNARTVRRPSEPANLTAYSNLPRQVALTWNAVEDPTVAGYVVYRSPAARGDFLPVARLEGRYRTTWVDRGLGALRVFYYRVAAVNAAGGEGEATPAARAVTKPEPLPPAGLRVIGQRLGTNVLSWDPNVEDDVAGYRVRRRRADQEGAELVAELGPGETVAEDPAVGAGERVTYRVTAFDVDALESAPSDAVEVESVGYGLHARVRDGAVHLEWDASVQEGLAETRVELEGSFGSRELGRAPRAGFVHDDVEPGGTYRYRLIGIRPDGTPAPPSAVLEVRVPD